MTHTRHTCPCCLELSIFRQPLLLLILKPFTSNLHVITCTKYQTPSQSNTSLLFLLSFLKSLFSFIPANTQPWIQGLGAGHRTGRGWFGFSRRTWLLVCGRPEHGLRFQRFVPAVGSSWAERKGNGGEIADLKVSDLGSLNWEFLQEFSMNAPGTLHFPSFQP